MKKLLLLLLIVCIYSSTYAQTVNIHFKNGTTINFHEDQIESIDFSEIPGEPTLTPGEAVDLGLSVMWASCNVGATTPTESGNYYAWGEVQPKDIYSLENYSYYDVATAQFTNIGSDISGTQFDAATVNIGGGWRMPSEEQFSELVSKCTWVWTQISGVNGYKISGTNGNSIFIPAAGSLSYDSHLDVGKYGFYWSSTEFNNKNHAICFCMSYGRANWGTSNKYTGHTVRPIISYGDYNGTSN